MITTPILRDLFSFAEDPGEKPPCSPISVRGDAAYCIKGPVCGEAADGSATQSQGACPSKGDGAIAHCLVSSRSFATGCIAPMDAHCVISATGNWECVYPDTDSSSNSEDSDNATEITVAAGRAAICTVAIQRRISSIGVNAGHQDIFRVRAGANGAGAQRSTQRNRRSVLLHRRGRRTRVRQEETQRCAFQWQYAVMQRLGHYDAVNVVHVQPSVLAPGRAAQQARRGLVSHTGRPSLGRSSSSLTRCRLDCSPPFGLSRRAPHPATISLSALRRHLLPSRSRHLSFKMPPHRQHSAEFQLQLDRIDDGETKPLTIFQQLPPVAEGCSRLYLCRHGQTDYNMQRKLQGRGVNMPLNAEGLDQAKCLAKAMKDVPLTAIYSSALKRAFQTADTVAQLHPKIEVQPFKEVEEMNFGQLEGHPMQVHEDQIQTMFKRWEGGELDVAWPGGESPRDVVARGVKKINEVVCNTPPKEQVLMVTHGRFNKIVLAEMLHGDITKMTDIHQDNTCVNVLDFDHATQTFHAMALNNIDHLPSPPLV